MKRLLLLIPFVFCFIINTNANTFDELFNFTVEGEIVTLSLRYEMLEPIYCDYVVDGELNRTVLVTTTPQTITLVTNTELASFDFYKINVYKNNERTPAGLATIDDIDLKIYFYGYSAIDDVCYNSYMSVSIPRKQLSRVNSEIINESCFCGFYSDVISNLLSPYEYPDFINEYDVQSLPYTLQNYCGLNYYKTMNPTTIKNTVIKSNDHIDVFDINGRMLPFHHLDELRTLSAGIYIVKTVDNGNFINYKYVVE